MCMVAPASSPRDSGRAAHHNWHAACLDMTRVQGEATVRSVSERVGFSSQREADRRLVQLQASVLHCIQLAVGSLTE